MDIELGNAIEAARPGELCFGDHDHSTFVFCRRGRRTVSGCTSMPLTCSANSMAITDCVAPAAISIGLAETP